MKKKLFIIGLVFLLVAGVAYARMNAAFIGIAGMVAGGGFSEKAGPLSNSVYGTQTSITTTTTANVAAGDLVVVGLCYISDKHSFNSVTDTAGNTYISEDAIEHSATGNRLLYSVATESSATNAITANLTYLGAGSARTSIVAWVFSANGTITRYATAGVGYDWSTTIQTPEFSTRAKNTIVFTVNTTGLERTLSDLDIGGAGVDNSAQLQQVMTFFKTFTASQTNIRASLTSTGTTGAIRATVFEAE